MLPLINPGDIVGIEIGDIGLEVGDIVLFRIMKSDFFTQNNNDKQGIFLL